MPPDPTNAVADDLRAAELGHHLFFDPRFSANNQVACATCHIPELAFTDGQPTAHGTRPNHRNTMSIIGVAHAPWLLWDGHKDSLWAQAVEPIEAVDEQGTTRLQAIHLLANDSNYRKRYEEIFGSLPELDDDNRFPDAGGPVDFLDYRERWNEMTPSDQAAATNVFANMGKAIAAYERLLNPGPARFDAYVEALLMDDKAAMQSILSDDELAGLRLFIGKANCIRCHFGPLFSDFSFHNTGIPPVSLPESVDRSIRGRLAAIESLLLDEFNCAGLHNDDAGATCEHLNVAQGQSQAMEMQHAFRTPILRNVDETAPYMHAGQFATLNDVMVHYDQAPEAVIGRSELRSLNLSKAEQVQLVTFLSALSSPPTAPPQLLAPP